MKLAIFHYHLNRGGVTRVVQNQLAALDAALAAPPGAPPHETAPGQAERSRTAAFDAADPLHAAVCYGGRRNDWDEGLAARLRAVRLALCPVPLLDYDDIHGRPADACLPELKAEVLAALGRLGFRPGETILHFHNHALGKNVAVPPLAAALAEEGYALLLQLHDFAEDFRPAGYRPLGALGPETLYPQAPAIHYAVLNDRDYRILRAAGVPDARLHLLPNPVPSLGRLPPRDEPRRRFRERFGVALEDRLLLYPVRCIRRKNVGEALLCALLGPACTVLALTLPPLNPAERPFYDEWKRLAERWALPCRFETGAPGSLRFPENLAAADVILSTSLAEGFGMVFLEAWLAGRPLAGRDLPEITRDFVRAGVRFDWLRAQLWVPVELVGLDHFLATAAEAYRRVAAAYRRPVPPDLDDLLRAKIDAGRIDFGDLDEPMQRDVIESVRRDPAWRSRILDANPGLEAALSLRAEDAGPQVAGNRRAIERAYSLRPSGQRLLAIYDRVAASRRGQPVAPPPAPERILASFLSPARFRLLRS